MAALHSLREAVVRPGVTLAEIRAPGQIAPYAVALSGDVTDILPDGVVAGPGRPSLAHHCDGRFVLLYDPEVQQSWHGKFRIVILVRTTMDADLAADPMLPRVMWDWLDEAIDVAGASEDTRAGTVTRSLSQSFGVIDASEESVEVELRASWTPRGDNLAAHLTAWTEVMCLCSGLEPKEPTESVVR